MGKVFNVCKHCNGTKFLNCHGFCKRCNTLPEVQNQKVFKAVKERGEEES